MSEVTHERTERRAQLSRRVALVISPHAGHAADGEAAEALASAGVTVGRRVSIDELDHNASLASQWSTEGFQAVIAAGGDGTVGGVASRLTGSDLPLGILPMGTSNNIARSLGISLNIADASATIASGTVLSIDAGEAVPLQRSPGEAGPGKQANRPELFLQALGLGWKVRFARLATDVSRRKRWGHLTYPVSALQALWHCRSLPVTLRFYADRAATTPTPPTEIHCRMIQLTVANTAIFGGAINLRLPNVRVEDNLLDFVLIEAPEPRHLRALGGQVVRAGDRLAESVVRLITGNRSYRTLHSARRHGGWLATVLPNIRHIQARAAIVETQKPEDVSLDGDIRAQTPILVRVAAHPVHILAVVRRPSELTDAFKATGAERAKSANDSRPSDLIPGRG